MKKASNQKVSKRKRELIRKRGIQWTFKEEDYCCEIASNFKTDRVAGELSQEEVMELLVLLMNSCKNSLVRVKDKNKRTYFNKPHQFTNKYEMLSEIIHVKGFIDEWINQYKKFKESRMRLEHRPTLGRIDSDKGYLIDNIEVQAYGDNAAQRARELYSKQCIALVARKADSTGMIFESPSATNAIARINEVMDLRLTKTKLKGNLDTGLTRFDNDYSVFIISRDRLLESPRFIEMEVLIHSIVDDASVRLVVLPPIKEEGCSKVRLQIDDLGIIYADFVDESIIIGELETNFKKKVVIK